MPFERLSEAGRNRSPFGDTVINELRRSGLISEPLVVSKRLVVVESDRFESEIADVIARAAAHPRKLRGLINDALAQKAAGSGDAKAAA